MLQANAGLRAEVDGLSGHVLRGSAETGSNRITFDAQRYKHELNADRVIQSSSDSPKLKSALKKPAKSKSSLHEEPPLFAFGKLDSKREEMGKRKNSIKDSSSSREKLKLRKSWMSPKQMNSSRSEKNSRANSGRVNSGRLGSKNNSFLTKDGALELSKNIDFHYPKVKALRDKQTLRQLLQIATPKKLQSKIKQKHSLMEIETRNSVASKPTSRRKSSKKEKQILGLMAGIVSKKNKEGNPKKLNLSKLSKESSQRESKTPLSSKSKRDKSVSKRGTSRLLIPDTTKHKGKQFQLK